MDGFFLFLNLNERGFAVFGRFASGNTRVLCECGFVTRIRHARREIVAVFMSCASADDASRQTRRIARFFFLSFFFFYDVLETNLSFFEARSCRFTRRRILWILCRRVLLATFYKNRIFFLFCFFFLFESQENSIRGINNAVKISISFVYANLLSRVASSSYK